MFLFILPINKILINIYPYDDIIDVHVRLSYIHRMNIILGFLLHIHRVLITTINMIIVTESQRNIPFNKIYNCVGSYINMES